MELDKMVLWKLWSWRKWQDDRESDVIKSVSTCARALRQMRSENLNSCTILIKIMERDSESALFLIFTLKNAPCLFDSVALNYVIGANSVIEIMW